MNTVEILEVGASALICGFMPIALFVNTMVAFPVIRGDGRAGFDIVQNKCLQRIRGTVQGNMQSNATHSLFLDSSLHSYRDDGFAFSSTAPLAGSGRTDEELIHLDASGQFLAVVADGAASEFLHPGPCCAVAAEA